MKIFAAVILLASPFVVAAPAASLESLQESWANEAQRLDADQLAYREAAVVQDKELTEAAAARKAVDDAISNPAVPVSELRRLEGILQRERDETFHAAEEAVALRARIYDTLEQMEHLAAEMKMPEGDFVSNTGIDGMWRAEWDQTGDFGVVKLETKGNLVTGTYRITDGRTGSLTGTVTDTEMRVETINAQTGARAQVNLTFDSGHRSASGTLLRQELAGGSAAAGNLELRKMDDAEVHEAMEHMR